MSFACRRSERGEGHRRVTSTRDHAALRQIMRNDLRAASASRPSKASKENAAAAHAARRSALETARGPIAPPQLVPNTARPIGHALADRGAGGGNGKESRAVHDDRTVFGHFRGRGTSCEKMKLKWVMEERKKNHHLTEVLSLIKRDAKRFGLR